MLTKKGKTNLSALLLGSDWWIPIIASIALPADYNFKKNASLQIVARTQCTVRVYFMHIHNLTKRCNLLLHYRYSTSLDKWKNCNGIGKAGTSRWLLKWIQITFQFSDFLPSFHPWARSLPTGQMMMMMMRRIWVGEARVGRSESCVTANERPPSQPWYRPPFNDDHMMIMMLKK